MAQVQLFSSQTTDGFSTAQAVSGLYTLHVRGVLDRAVVRVHVSPTGQEDYIFLGDPQFAKEGSRNIELEGSLKLQLVNAGADTEIDAYLDGPI